MFPDKVTSLIQTIELLREQDERMRANLIRVEH